VKSEIWWYSARVGGVVAWALLAASLLAAVALPSRILARRVAPTTLVGLQRFLTATAVAFTGIHLLGSALAEQVDLGPADLVVPLAAPDQPGAVAWGIVAMGLVLALAVASLAGRRTGRRVWLVAHLLSLGAFVAGTVHALTVSGTDIDHPAVWWSSALAAAAIVGGTIARLLTNANPFPAVGASTTPPDDIELELQQRERDIAAQLRRDGDRPDPALLERTLAGLRSLDERPVASDAGLLPGPFDLLVPPPAAAQPAPVPTFPPQAGERRPMVDRDDLAPGPGQPAPPLPLTPSQAVSGSLFPSAEDVRQTAGPLDLTVPPGLQEHVPAPPAWDDRPADRDRRPSEPPVPATDRELPVRTPRRLARTTAAAARIDAWQPARTAPVPSAGPPAPPSAIDPVTGEPDPTAYRQWLKDWLAYVESQS
jgi:hypothetical protein